MQNLKKQLILLNCLISTSGLTEIPKQSMTVNCEHSSCKHWQNNHFMLDTKPCQYMGQWEGWHCSKISSFFAHYKYEASSTSTYHVLPSSVLTNGKIYGTVAREINFILFTPQLADADIIFLHCGFYLLLSFFPRLISVVGDWMSTILPSSTHGANLEYMSEMCCTRLAEIQDAKNRHFGTIARLCRPVSSQLRHVSTIGKKLVKQQYLPHTSLQYGELRPTSRWD